MMNGQIELSKYLAQFNLEAIGADVTVPPDPEALLPSHAIRSAVGNAYIAFVRARAEALNQSIKDKPDDEAMAAQKKATIELIAQTSLLCGAMVNFVVSSFVNTPAERERLVDTVFRDMRSRIEQAQEHLDSIRKMTLETPDGQ